MSRTGTSDRRALKRLIVAAALLTAAFPPRGAADEYDPPGRVARLRYVQGAVSFQPAGGADWVQASVNRPTTTGDRLWTEPGARTELSVGSATVRLAGATGFSFLNLDDRTVQIELTQGTLGVHVRRLGRDEIFEVDTPNQAFTILRPGEYRIEASEDGQTTFVIVRDGEGEATGAGQTYSVRSGEAATFTGVDSLRADVFDAGGTDEFDEWGRSRDRHDDRSRSARYVSRDVVGYEDLDDYGTWRSDPSYGNVWVPARVARDWAPYREGHWAWISPWGWTWVDDEPWGYAPFHYGRWVHVGGSWGWVPGPMTVQPVYAPALVAFIGGPGFALSVSVGGGGYAGNVGWFPLGPREVYVPAYHVSPAYVNRVNVSNTTVSNTTITTVYNTQVTNNYSSTNVTYVNRTVPGGVTAVPHTAFTGSQPVARAAVAVNVQQVASAPVGARVAVAPTRESVLGIHASTASNAARPPAAVANRAVVAKAPPPPPPVPFARQQEVLATHPGQPLARQEVERLRPADRAAAALPLVKQAPPGKPATPERGRPGVQPAAAKPATAQPASPPAGKPQEPRTQPSAQPKPDTGPAAASPGQPARSQPPSAPPGKPRDAGADRPPSKQPSAQPEPATTKSATAQPTPAQPATTKPTTAQPASPPAGKPQEPRTQPSAQPKPDAGPGAASPGQPARSQPPSAPPGKPRDAGADRPPSKQPSAQPQAGAPYPGKQQPGPQTAPSQSQPKTPAEPGKDKEKDKEER